MDASDDPEHSASSDANLARDHLANERTYLAWLRSGVAVMALGLAIAGFADTTTATSISAGAILVLTGTGGVAYGTVRYREIRRRLESGTFTAVDGGRMAAVTSSLLVVAILAALVILLIGRR